MHFLGLAGMPRRIPDYPDAFLYWNKVATLGSNVSLVSSIIFFYLIFHTSRNQFPWRTNQVKWGVFFRYNRPLIGDPKEAARSNYWSVNFVRWRLPLKKVHKSYLGRLIDYTKGVYRDATEPKKVWPKPIYRVLKTSYNNDSKIPINHNPIVYPPVKL
jgi:hypothetical protein